MQRAKYKVYIYNYSDKVIFHFCVKAYSDLDSWHVIIAVKHHLQKTT